MGAECDVFECFEFLAWHLLVLLVLVGWCGAGCTGIDHGEMFAFYGCYPMACTDTPVCLPV